MSESEKKSKCIPWWPDIIGAPQFPVKSYPIKFRKSSLEASWGKSKRLRHHSPAGRAVVTRYLGVGKYVRTTVRRWMKSKDCLPNSGYSQSTTWIVSGCGRVRTVPSELDLTVDSVEVILIHQQSRSMGKHCSCVRIRGSSSKILLAPFGTSN